jgi:hypothetical protein
MLIPIFFRIDNTVAYPQSYCASALFAEPDGVSIAGRRRATMFQNALHEGKVAT